jgi:hypothetical protein
MNEEQAVYRQFIREFGSVMANGTYDVTRPNYLASNTPSTFIVSQLSMRCDPQKGPYPESQLPHVDYYSVFTSRCLVEAGDIITPNPSKVNVPVLTVDNVDDTKECIAFRTGRIGSILASNAATDTLFTNVAFDYSGLVDPAMGINTSDPSSPPIVQARAVMWYRPINTGNYLLDVLTGTTYAIRNIQYIGSVMVLDLRVQVNDQVTS